VVPFSLYYGSEQNVLSDALLRDMKTICLPGLLRYEGRNSMISSIESRVRFLSPAPVNFVRSLSERYIIDVSNGPRLRSARQCGTSFLTSFWIGWTRSASILRSNNGFPSSLRGAKCTPASETARRIPAVDTDHLCRDWKAVKSGKKTS